MKTSWSTRMVPVVAQVQENVCTLEMSETESRMLIHLLRLGEDIPPCRQPGDRETRNAFLRTLGVSPS